MSDPEPSTVAPCAPPRWRRRALAFVGPVLAGFAFAASLPPWGFWPLGFVGVVALDRVLARRRLGARFRRGWLVAVALFAPTLWWIHDLTLPGYVIAVIVFAVMFGLCLMVVPPGVGRRVALPGAWVLAEQWKGAFPFGGVPISNLSIGQVAGPLAGTLRLFGWSFLSMLVIVGGVALAAALDELEAWWRRRRASEAASLAGPDARESRSRRRTLRANVGCLALGVVVLAASAGVASVAPRGHPVGHPVRVAVVQGGGPQGTRAINTDMDVVFQRHLDASRRITQPVDLVLWPEDVVDVTGVPGRPDLDISDSAKGRKLQALARRLHSSVIAGVVENSGRTHFLNFSIAYGPDGAELGRYEKVHRVPFGEYVPFRSFVEQFAGPDLTQRDAIAGHGPAVLHTPGVTWGVSISWEIFFAGRARSAVSAGGEVLLNPTNGSTYTGTLVQTQQVASSRQRAIEQGRWVLQAAPTGFSAIIDPSGHVLQRSGISEAAVLQGTVQPRRGLTLYNRLGEWPMLAAAVVLVLAGWWLDVRSRRRARLGRR